VTLVPSVFVEVTPLRSSSRIAAIAAVLLAIGDPSYLAMCESKT
jgi:hypothetical protein